MLMTDADVDDAQSGSLDAKFGEHGNCQAMRGSVLPEVNIETE